MRGLKFLFGDHYDLFQSEYFEKKHMIVSRNQNDYFDKLLNKEKIENYLENGHLTFPEVRLVKEATAIDQNDYIQNAIIQKKGLFEHFINGATIAFSGLHKYVSSLKELVLDLETQTGHRFQTNIYLTPPSSQGFKIHYDSHDVIVCQVGGSKKWRIYDNSPIRLPHHDQKFVEGQFKPGKCIEEFTLYEGDTLYIPRGVWHEALADGEYSMHITVGFMGSSWSDILVNFIKQSGFNDATLREYVPYNLLKGDDSEAMKSRMKELLLHVVDKGNFDLFIQANLKKEIASVQKPAVTNFIGHAVNFNKITSSTIFKRTSDLEFELEEVDESIKFLVAGEEFQLPYFTKDAVVYVLNSGEAFSVTSVPQCIDENGIINLLKSFVLKGILRIEQI